MTIYYVYAYLRANGTPFYIGKGKGRRAYEKHRKTLPKPHTIVFLEKNLTDIGALAIERRMIRWYGRKDIGTGCLLNRSDGGDGATQGPITRAKMSVKAKARSTPKRMREIAIMTDAKREKLRAASLANGSRPPSQKGKKFWTNGISNTANINCPGPEWYLGRIKPPRSCH